MSTLSTHVLDAVQGKPAHGIQVGLFVLAVEAGPAGPAENGWQLVASGRTDADGRIKPLGSGALAPGTYRITFDTEAWFAAQSVEAFYPGVSIDFRIVDEQHYHVPLLLSPFAYSTYRGS